MRKIKTKFISLLLLFVIAVFTLSFAACKDKNDIVGKWEYSLDYGNNLTLTGIYRFYNDKTGYHSMYSPVTGYDSFDFNYEITDDQIVITAVSTKKTTYLDYELKSKNTLIIDGKTYNRKS